MTSLDNFRRVLSPKPELLEQKLKDHHVYSVAISFFGACLAPLMWIWDYVTDPLGAQQTIGLRMLFFASFCGAAAFMWLKNRRLLATASVIGMLVGEVIFLEILNRLQTGMMYGIGGFLFFLIVANVALQGFSLRVNLAASVLISLLPHLLALTGMAQHFPHAQYAVLVWPATMLTMVIQFAFALSYQSRYDANIDLLAANAKLALAADTLHMLDQTGRDITANLDMEAVFEALYRHTGELLDAPFLSIYRTNASASALDRAFGRKYGKRLPPSHHALNSTTSYVARCARQRQALLVESDPEQLATHAKATGHDMKSLLFVPLIVNQRLLGVMSILSEHEQAYGARERLIFHTLCAYGAIALDNAINYQQLQEMQAQLVAQEKLTALGSVVAAVAHELNTPIGNGLVMASALAEKTHALQRKMEGAGIRRSDLEEYMADSQQAATLIMRGLTNAANLVANFKQVAVDRTSAQRRRFDLQQTCHEVIATMMNQVKTAGHDLHFAVSPGIVMDSYPEPLGQVLINLISNALVHAFADDQHGKMHLSAQKTADERVRILFQDDGCGISEAHQKRIFDPFFTTKMGQGGNGLGLHISYNIITSLLSGQIRVESTPGHGACFILDFPCHAAS
jgi:signal transduction histidine kinase/putative methionine-R-sulfoxide reductase with GAF domain